MTVSEIITQLKKQRNPVNIAGMARFGIKPKKEPLGIPMGNLRKLASQLKKETKDPKERHKLALELWETEIFEARMIAGFIDIPDLATESQMEGWVLDFDNWAICDTICGSFLDRTPLAYKKALEWTNREEEYVKRAGFVVGTWLSVHDKKMEDEKFLPFLKAIKREAKDERIYVKKAVNWALRQIGKSRNKNLYKLAVETANELKKMDSKSAKWIATDALRELNSENVKKRIFLKR